MSLLKRFVFALSFLVGLLLLASCGTDTDLAEVASGTDAASAASTDGEDHDDEDHDGEDHDGEDHDDEDHGDEDHDDDHGNEDHDHDGEDHDDEDHDDEEVALAADDDHDHDDEDHDDDHGDEDHDDHDHGDEDHDDEDHDDEDHDDEDHDDHDHDGEERAFDAHVHGVADLFIAASGGDVVIDFVSPTDNIFGFEYEPETDEDVALAADRTSVLAQPNVLSFNEEAGCTLVTDVEPELEFEGNHAEVEASWLFTCDNPDEIRQLDASVLFAEFPRIQDLDAQWVTDAGSSAAELSPSSTILAFG